MWECSQERRDEWVGEVKNSHNNRMSKALLFSKLGGALSTHFQNPEERYYQILDTWNWLMADYRSRLLTEPKDRVMACAGIARAVQKISQMTYIAGLWIECIVVCLDWTVEPWEEQDARKSRAKTEEPTVRKVPTWSWFSIPISPRWNVKLNHEHHNGRCFHLIHQAQFRFFQWPYSPRNEMSPDSFHDFEGLRLALSMQLCSSDMFFSDNPSFVAYLKFQLRRCGSPDCFAALKLDVYWKACGPTSGAQRLALLRETQPRRDLKELLSEKRWYKLTGLLLVQGPEEGTWQRIGAWNFEVGFYKVLSTGETLLFDYLFGASEEEVTLV